MRFSSCFGNQSPSHRDTRLSPHPGKFQHIFAKNAKMLARKTFENTFAIIVFFFACFHGLLLTRHCSLNLWTCPHRDQGFNLKLKRALVLPGVWTRHNLKSWFQKFFLFQELNVESWSQKSQVSEISNLIQSLVRFFQSDCFEFCWAFDCWLLTQWEKAGPRSKSSSCCISWIHIAAPVVHFVFHFLLYFMNVHISLPCVFPEMHIRLVEFLQGANWWSMLFFSFFSRKIYHVNIARIANAVKCHN